MIVTCVRKRGLVKTTGAGDFLQFMGRRAAIAWHGSTPVVVPMSRGEAAGFVLKFKNGALYLRYVSWWWRAKGVDVTGSCYGDRPSSTSRQNAGMPRYAS